MITAKVELTQPLKQQRQFVTQSGRGHNFLLDDTAGGTGPKPIELVAAARVHGVRRDHHPPPEVSPKGLRLRDAGRSRSRGTPSPGIHDSANSPCGNRL